MNYTENWNEITKRNLAFLDRNSLVNAVEIGAFEGLTSNFIVDELLAPNNGLLVCIDPLETDYALDGDGSLFAGQYERFIENTEQNKDQIVLMRQKSKDAMPLLRESFYELCFVDGDHTETTVYGDVTEAFRIVKVDGYILIDDIYYCHQQFVRIPTSTAMLAVQKHSRGGFGGLLGSFSDGRVTDR